NSSSLTNTVQLNGDTGRGCAVTRAPLRPFARAYCSPNSIAFVLSTYWNPTYAASSAVAATDGHLERKRNAEASRPARTIPVNQRPLMTVVPSPARQSD